MDHKLDQRRSQGHYRQLEIWSPENLDFCSNDYLGLARSREFNGEIASYLASKSLLLGCTGSRLIAGQNEVVHSCELLAARIWGVESALLFSTGYAANEGLLPAVCSEQDVILCDQEIHASLRQGCRLASGSTYFFRHNDAHHVEQRLKRLRESGRTGEIFLVCESLYSMDGLMAPLKEFAALAQTYGAKLIVDEAHAMGTLGPCGLGLVAAQGLGDDVFARIFPLGKAFGFHGAFILGESRLRELLVNFATSFVYSTGLPYSSLYVIEKLLTDFAQDRWRGEREALHQRMDWAKRVADSPLPPSPIMAFYGESRAQLRAAAEAARAKGFMVKPIYSPTVPKGRERIRVTLHGVQTQDQISQCFEVLRDLCPIPTATLSAP